MVFQLFMRLGGLQAGFMADWIGAQLSLGLGAALSLIFGIWIAITKPQIRRL
jgi:hypothetical protein